jgi:FkbM family methyltransferase
MRSRAGLELARAPRLYAWLLRRRRAVNLEKLCFLALVRRGDVVVEAGANQGYYTALFSHLVGRRGRVHAFEPVPATYQVLAAHLARRGRFDNVVLNRCALADGDGELVIHVPATDPAQASLARHSAGSWAAAPEVHAHACAGVTIDSYLRRRGAAPPDFVKCDAEGAELRIVQGAAETLRRRPPILHLEINPDWSRDMGWQPADLPAYLEPFGYRDFILVEDLSIRRLADPRAALAAFRGSANLLCAVPELHGARLDGLRAVPGGRGERDGRREAAAGGGRGRGRERA